MQRRLAEFGYSGADDPVMAEYVVVMLANSKTADDITRGTSALAYLTMSCISSERALPTRRTARTRRRGPLRRHLHDLAL